MKLYFWSLVYLKLVVVVAIHLNGFNNFGWPNDSDYYDAYALGYNNVAVNVWAVILRFLNDYDLYSRQSLNLILIFISFILVPFLVAQLTIVRGTSNPRRIFWISAVTIGAYPILFYCVLDIYRDVFMLFCFLLGLVLIRHFLEQKKLSNRIIPLIPIFLIGYFLYLLRPYLGFGFIGALFLTRFYSFRQWPFAISLLLYLGALNVAYALGFLEPLLTYRNNFTTVLQGGSNLGILFNSESTFALNFIKSFSYQVLGLYFFNLSSILVFLIESIPFIFFLIYLIKNRQYSNKFVDFLIVFFMLYTTIWLLGNDNLGSAVRLRMYSYISIFICSMIVYQKKQIMLSKQVEVL